MDRDHGHGKLSTKIKMKSQKRKANAKDLEFPFVSIDNDADFAAIKLAPGIEAKSYLKDGVLFSEDAKGRIIELQILNLSLTAQPKPKKQRKVG